jgi:hypothetical protein
VLWERGTWCGPSGRRRFPCIFPAGHVVVVVMSHCRFTHSSHRHGPPHHQFVTVPRRYLIAINLREHRHKHQHQAPSTKHNPQNTQHRNPMFECGVAVRSLFINQFPAATGYSVTMYSLPQLSPNVEVNGGCQKISLTDLIRRVFRNS